MRKSFRGSLAATAASGLVVAGIIGGAPAAHAADVTVTVKSFMGSNMTTDPSSSLEVPDGDTWVVSNNYGEAIVVTGSCSAAGGTVNEEIGDGASWRVTNNNTSAICSLTASSKSNPLFSTSLVVEFLSSTPPGPPGPPAPPSPSPSDSSNSASPLPVMQQFGVPSSGNCEEGASDEMNLSGVSGGGWGISWAQWLNGQLGDAVCTRSLMYDPSQAKWVVN